MTPLLLLTGRPGVGKTTVVLRLIPLLGTLHLAGFTTAEVRVGGSRVGFEGVTFDGRRHPIADVGHPGPLRVGRYGVDVAAVDRMAAALDTAPDVDCYLVDEIGRMECLSEVFVAAVRRLLAGPRPVVATVAAKGGGLIAEVKRHPNALLWEVTPANRDRLPQRVAEWVAAN